jgi:hypothetical protein
MDTWRKYRISVPTFVLLAEDGRDVAHMVPQGTIVTVEHHPFDGNKMVQVMWDGKTAMMFVEDLLSRSERVTGYRRG